MIHGLHFNGEISTWMAVVGGLTISWSSGNLTDNLNGENEGRWALESFEITIFWDKKPIWSKRLQDISIKIMATFPRRHRRWRLSNQWISVFCSPHISSDRASHMWRHVSDDGSPWGSKVLRWAIQVLWLTGAELLVLVGLFSGSGRGLDMIWSKKRQKLHEDSLQLMLVDLGWSPTVDACNLQLILVDFWLLGSTFPLNAFDIYEG